MIIGNKNYIAYNNQANNINKLDITKFNHSYISPKPVNNKIPENNINSNEMKNQYNQLESNFINLKNQYQKLKNDRIIIILAKILFRSKRNSLT